MNKEKLEARIKQLEQERDQVRANLMAYDGAIQDNQYWLQQLEVKEEDGKTDNSE